MPDVKAGAGREGVDQRMMHNMETERALLGAILTDEQQYDNVLEYVSSPEAFYTEANQKIFAVMQELKAGHQNIDLVTVADRLPQAAQYIAELTSAVVTSAHAEDYAKQVADKHLKRELFRACEEGKKMTMSDIEAAEVVSEIDSLLGKVGRGISLKGAKLSELAVQRLDKYMDDEVKGIHWEGIKTGFVDVDELIDGFALGENVILAARPSMGKTAWALNIALNVAKKGVHVSFFSMEMSKERITDRLLCMEGSINAKRMRVRKLSPEEVGRIQQAEKVLQGLPITIYDGSMNTSKIRSVLARSKGDAFAVIDYLTLLTDHPNLSSNERYGTIAKTIQGIGADFKIPMLTLSQLNRKPEERTNRRPILSDLRESGDIEAAADKVIFLYRDEYYNPNTDDRGVAEVICSKNRDGETGMEKLYWRPEILRFGDISWREGGE